MKGIGRQVHLKTNVFERLDDLEDLARVPCP
jgi:hypothetical protein